MGQFSHCLSESIAKSFYHDCGIIVVVLFVLLSKLFNAFQRGLDKRMGVTGSSDAPRPMRDMFLYGAGYAAASIDCTAAAVLPFVVFLATLGRTAVVTGLAGLMLGLLVLMIVVVVAIAFSAIQRFAEPREVAGVPVMVIATIGLVMNIVVAAILMRGEQTMNVRGALIHVLGDLLGSVAAIVAGAVILLTGWMPIDPLLSLAVSALILVSAWRLLKEVVHVLMEGVPKGVDAEKVSDELAGVEGVHSVHDLHIWSLSSSQRALAAHIEIGRMSDWQTILPRLQALLAERFSITHTTLQPEDRQTAMTCAMESDCGVAT